MPTRSIHTHTQNLLVAAEALLAARDHQMVTADEWDAFRRAVNAHRRFQSALDRWSIVDDVLTCCGVRRTGRCTFRTFVTIAAAIDELSGRSFLASDLRQPESLPAAEVTIALNHLLLHGCIERRGGRRYGATANDTYIDATKAWNWLAATTTE